MRWDAEMQTPEDDLSHREEILALHDLERDPGAPSREVFEQRCRENPSTRAMHHHVFVSRTVVEVCQAAGLEVMLLRPELPYNIVCLCRVGTGEDAAAGMSDTELAVVMRSSPFATDRAEAG